MNALVESLVDSVFQHIHGGLTYTWDYTLDLSVLCEQMKDITDPETPIPPNEYTLFLSPDIDLYALKSVPITTEKIQPFCTSVFPTRQAFFADMIRHFSRFLDTTKPLKIHYRGHEQRAWNDFWTHCNIVFQNVETCADFIMIDSTFDVLQLPIDQVRVLCDKEVKDVKEVTTYIELVHSENLIRYVEMAQHFETCFFASSPHSGFPENNVYFVGCGLRKSNNPNNHKSVYSTFIRLYQKTCLRWHRTVQRYHYVQMYPKERLYEQPVFLKWQQDMTEYWQQFKPPPSPSYNPTSPVLEPTEGDGTYSIPFGFA